jgi:hypothetical protein
MMRNGTVYRLPPLAHHTTETDYGLWPTPSARDYKDLSTKNAHLAARQRHQKSSTTQLLEVGAPWRTIYRAYEMMMGYPSRHTVIESVR